MSGMFRSKSHYVENTGQAPLKFIELFRSNRFEDVSLNQWLALTPPLLVKSHLALEGHHRPFQQGKESNRWIGGGERARLLATRSASL